MLGNFFHVLVSTHTVFLVQFGINIFTLVSFFQKRKLIQTRHYVKLWFQNLTYTLKLKK